MLLGADMVVCFCVNAIIIYKHNGQGSSSVGWVLVCEFATANGRSFVISLFSNFAWVIGYMAIGVLAMTVHSWRNQLLFSTLPFCIMSVAYVWYIVIFINIYLLITTCQDNPRESTLARSRRTTCRRGTVDRAYVTSKQTSNSIGGCAEERQ
jgi:hypothetical protein